MAKVKVKIDLDIIDDLKAEIILNRVTQKKVWRIIVNAMADSISKGLSPVRGVGRFKAYAEQRDADDKKYPKSIRGKHPNKKTRPVNLNLTGALIKHLTSSSFESGTGSFDISMENGSSKIADIAEAHNNGTLESKNVPKRQFIPNNKKDEFTVSIVRLYTAEIEKRINELIKKSN